MPVHHKTIFAIVAAALLMLSLDGTIVATALHTMQVELRTSTAWIGWTITAYSLALVLMLPLSGSLSDRYGRRTVFLASISVFTIASLLCGLAPNIQSLIVLRFLQALGGAGFTPSATGIIVEHFGANRDKAVGLFGSIFPIGTMVGPMLGGFIVGHVSWRWIFLANVPIGLAVVPLALRFIPADRGRGIAGRLRIDVVGLVTLGSGLVAFMTGMSGLGSPSTPWWLSSALLVGALVSLVAFVVRQERSRDPLIEPRLIWGRGFAAVNGLNAITGGAVAGLMSLLPFYATTRYGIDALGAAFLLVAQSIAVIGLSIAASMLIRRTGYRRPIHLGVVIAALGMAALALTPHGLGPRAWLAAAAALIGAGVGWLGPASRNAGLQLAPDRASSLAALRTLGRQFGMIGAVSITTAVISASTQPAVAQARVYLLFPVILLAANLIVRRVPEHRGAW